MLFGIGLDGHQGFGGADDDTGGGFAIGTEVTTNDHRATVDSGLGDGIERAAHQAAPATDTVLQAVGNDAGFRVFAQVAHDAGIHAPGVVAVAAYELDLVTLEQVTADLNAGQGRVVLPEVGDGAGCHA